MVDFSLYLVTDRKATLGRPLLPLLEECLAAGVKAIQLREKDLSGRELYELAAGLRTLTRQHGARLLINDRIDIALAVDADGVHLPSDSFPPEEARRLVGPGKLIGVSTHSLDEARAAQKEGAEFIVFGPIFDTPSKREYGAPLGVDRLSRVAASVSIPVFAIGGVKAASVRKLRESRAAGVAVISAVLGARNPARAVKELLEAWQAA